MTGAELPVGVPAEAAGNDGSTTASRASFEIGPLMASPARWAAAGAAQSKVRVRAGHWRPLAGLVAKSSAGRPASRLLKPREPREPRASRSVAFSDDSVTLPRHLASRGGAHCERHSLLDAHSACNNVRCPRSDPRYSWPTSLE